MTTRSLLAPLLGLALAACAERGDLLLSPPFPVDPAAVPERIVLAGVTLTLETYLWRDFMPVSPPDGQPLAAVFRLRTGDGSPLPPGLAVRSAIVFHQGQIWVSAPVVGVPSDPTVLEVVSRGGPRWGPDVSVDVVVTLTLGGHDRALLRAADQLIHRTD